MKKNVNFLSKSLKILIITFYISTFIMFDLQFNILTYFLRNNEILICYRNI